MHMTIAQHVSSLLNTEKCQHPLDTSAWQRKRQGCSQQTKIHKNISKSIQMPVFPHCPVRHIACMKYGVHMVQRFWPASHFFALRNSMAALQHHKVRPSTCLEETHQCSTCQHFPLPGSLSCPPSTPCCKPQTTDVLSTKMTCNSGCKRGQ